MEPVSFIKMHGLGNDFVIIDARRRPFALSARQAQAIADRRRGIGCDQVIVLDAPRGKDEDVFMRIRNADGSESSACGNATRCVGALLMNESGRTRAVIATKAGELAAELVDKGASRGQVTIDFGPARLGWREIPVAREVDTLHLPPTLGPLTDPAGCSMGNPHATFFVPDAAAIDLAALGPKLEHDPLFPERANIGVAQIIARDHIRLRVWERGAGITEACGTGACAALVNAHRRGLTERTAKVQLDGGTLTISWREPTVSGEEGHVLMTGPVAVTARGTIDPSLISEETILVA